MRNPWRGLGGLPREIWLLFTANLVNRAGMMVLPMLLIYLTRELGFTPARAGFVFSAYGITAIVIGPLAGRLADRVGPLPLMRASLLLSGTAILFYPLARTFPAVIAITCVWAAVSELFRPASLSAITGVVPPEQRKAAFAVHRLAINLGMSVGPALGGFLAAISFRYMFIVDGVTSIVAGIVLASAAWNPFESGDENAPSLIGAQRVLSPTFLVFLIGVVLSGIVFFQHEGAMPLFITKELHLSPAFYGLLFTLNTLMIVAMEVPLNMATSHWANRSTMVIAAMLFAVGFGALAFVSTPMGVIATVVVWTFGEMLLFPSMSAHMGDIVPPERRGAYMGAYSMALSAAFAVGPWLGTAIFSRFGSSTVWVTMFFVGAASAVLLSVSTPRANGALSESASGS
ncbi:MAG: MFS transporter [Gemmatimonadaceae bacterium]|nr:MFS transporter [Gemmatimonadaceae bacterium]